MPLCEFLSGYPRESRREMVSEGRTGATLHAFVRLDGP